MSKDNKKLVFRKQGEDGYKTFSIRLDNETVAEIDVIASKINKSRNNVIKRLITYALDNCIIEDDDTTVE